MKISREGTDNEAKNHNTIRQATSYQNPSTGYKKN